MNRFHAVTPILRVASFPAALDYYNRKLGFAKKWDWNGTFGCVERGVVEIFLCEGEQGHPGTWIYISTDDVDALHAEYLQTGATIRMPPTNQPWGSRELHIEDLDGHRLRIASDATGPADPDAAPRFQASLATRTG